jgi:hypothetical protein
MLEFIESYVSNKAQFFFDLSDYRESIIIDPRRECLLKLISQLLN